MTADSTRRSRLVAICGIDGSGKATQTDLLARRAEADGLAVESLSFPRYGDGFFGELIERYLRGEFAPRAGDVSPYLASLPYACDRWEAAPRIRAWLDEGRLVLCNRYVPANVAHQGAKMTSEQDWRAFADWVDRLEYGVFGLPRPDLHLLLDVPAAIAARLCRHRRRADTGADQRDIHEDDMAHLEATAAIYRRLAQEGAGRWLTVQCLEGDRLLPPDRIADRAWAEAQAILYNAMGEKTTECGN